MSVEATPFLGERMSGAQQPVLPPVPMDMDADLDFSDLRREFEEEGAEPQSTLAPANLSLEGWELQPTQTIIGSSAVYCQLCGKVLSDSFEKALEVCESCRNLPLSSPAVPPNMEVAGLGNRTTGDLIHSYASEEGPLARPEEVEGLSNQYTPPYAFEGPPGYISNVPSQSGDAQEAAVGVAFSSRRGLWFWLRWILIGCGVALLLVLLFLALVFIGR